jgi:hypothetical protein
MHTELGLILVSVCHVALLTYFPELNSCVYICFQKKHTESGGRGAMRAEKEFMMRVVTPS